MASRDNTGLHPLLYEPILCVVIALVVTVLGRPKMVAFFDSVPLLTLDSVGDKQVGAVNSKYGGPKSGASANR